MKQRIALAGLVCLLLFLTAPFARAAGNDPFGVAASVESRDGTPAVVVQFTIPPGHILYSDRIHATAAGQALEPLDVPAPVTIKDKLSGADESVYRSSFTAVYRVTSGASPTEVTIAYQGCNESVCFFPQKRTLQLAGGTAAAAAPVKAAGSGDWRALADGFEITARDSGYLSPKQFIAFLDRAGSPGGVTDVESPLDRAGALAAVFLILLGGIGLNLTPCVLPLVPVNLAIIGAGAQCESRGRGFRLGLAYAGGIALVYGTLGVVTVLTGSKFGALNASPWVNLVIAIVFTALGLAMFDLFRIDFTRFGSHMPGHAGARGRYAAAAAMGGVSALLAGACVAPVVISVLLLAGNLYSKGHAYGLLLPFLLGVGMGLPWPFAGAGLSFLPKPGRWMTWVKRGFAVLILALAAYYGHVAWRLFAPDGRWGGGADRQDAALAESLAKAHAAKRPVFIDFGASWCKNCLAMDETTFRDAAVKAKLAVFEQVRYAAEQPNQPPARDVLDRFGVTGLPTYVILTPKK